MNRYKIMRHSGTVIKENFPEDGYYKGKESYYTIHIRKFIFFWPNIADEISSRYSCPYYFCTFDEAVDWLELYTGKVLRSDKNGTLN